MKINTEKIILSKGEFSKSTKYAELYGNIKDGIKSVTWGDPYEFIINPISKGNGVLPIKKNFIAHLKKNGWESEVKMSLIKGLGMGPIDSIYRTDSGLVAVEWETGNISSSHRALNKIALGIIQKQLIAGFLILPVRIFSKYLTDRVGNYEELAPYFSFYENVQIESGVIGVIGVEHDKVSEDVSVIPKGKDGNSLQNKINL